MAVLAVVRTIVVRLLGADQDRPPCPKCHDDRLVEFDRVLQRFVCDVCSHQWRRPAAE